jgi:hypothetical protein
MGYYITTAASTPLFAAASSKLNKGSLSKNKSAFFLELSNPDLAEPAAAGESTSLCGARAEGSPTI